MVKAALDNTLEHVAKIIIHERLSKVYNNHYFNVYTWGAMLQAMGANARSVAQRVVRDVNIPAFSYGQLFYEFGLTPWEIWQSDIPADAGTGLDAPLSLASAMLQYDVAPDHGRRIARTIVERDKTQQPVRRLGDVVTFWSGTLFNTTRPEQFGLPPIQSLLSSSGELPQSIEQLGWFSHDMRETIARRCTSYNAILNASMAIEDPAPAQLAARLHLYTEKRQQPNYKHMALLLRGVDPNHAREYLRATSGVRESLCVVRPDATSEEMVKGLRCLMNNERPRSELSGCLGRVPTEEETKDGLRPCQALIDWLYTLPQEQIDVLAGYQSLQAKMLVGVGNGYSLSKLQEVFSPHKNREKPLSETWYGHNWADAMHAMVVGYTYSDLLRGDLNYISGGNPYIAFLYALQIARRSGVTKRKLGPLAETQVEVGAAQKSDAFVQSIMKQHPGYESFVELKANLPLSHFIQFYDVNVSYHDLSRGTKPRQRR